MYEIYRYVFLGCAAAAAVMLIISVVLFFKLQIPKVISDLSGRTARRAIEDIRRQNEATGDKSYKSSHVNLQRGKLTDKISNSGRIVPRAETPFGTGMITEKISTARLAQTEQAPETAVLTPENETSVLTENNETTVLYQANETSVLSPSNETSVLDSGYGETSVLQMPEEEAVPQFTIEFEITYIHTNEVIN